MRLSAEVICRTAVFMPGNYEFLPGIKYSVLIDLRYCQYVFRTRRVRISIQQSSHNILRFLALDSCFFKLFNFWFFVDDAIFLYVLDKQNFLIILVLRLHVLGEKNGRISFFPERTVNWMKLISKVICPTCILLA